MKTQYVTDEKGNMPDYQILISKTAQKQLDELPDNDPVTVPIVSSVVYP